MKVNSFGAAVIFGFILGIILGIADVHVNSWQFWVWCLGANLLWNFWLANAIQREIDKRRDARYG